MNAVELDRLLIKIQRGDNCAFEELYIATRKGVYAFLHTYFQNTADTEDGVQSVYLRIKMNASSYRRGSNARAWILQIAKNYALDVLKKARREIPSEEIEIVTEPIVGETTILELMKRLLSEEEQRIVTLHVLWEYKHREIADMLDIPTGTVTSKYKRAIEKLRKALV
jgi:RNA polymerase sigma-70 factor (ECF subfamily)